MPAPKTPEVAAFWRAFREAPGVNHDDYDVVRFGDTAAMADALAELVVSGPKRATAGLLRDFNHGGEPMPRAEGEGDLSLAYWREGHRRFFQRQAEREGAFDEDAEVVCERFRVVWPAQIST